MSGMTYQAVLRENVVPGTSFSTPRELDGFGRIESIPGVVFPFRLLRHSVARDVVQE